MTDGIEGHPSNKFQTMFEIFNSKVKPLNGSSMNSYDKGFHHNNHLGSNGQEQFRQFISNRTKDVSVSCYLGKEAAIKDYSKFNAARLSKKDVV